jgi:hypothetical protein
MSAVDTSQPARAFHLLKFSHLNPLLRPLRRPLRHLQRVHLNNQRHQTAPETRKSKPISAW